MKPSNEIQTVQDLLERWDAGETIWSVECGGLGPGYEQALQIAAVEFARATKDLVGIKPDDKNSTERFRAACHQHLKIIDDSLLGLSGAQAGAAQWLAFQWCFGCGPAGLIERCKKKGEEDRCIQVSRDWPKAPIHESTSHETKTP